MKWSSSLSLAERLDDAVAEAAAELREQIDGNTPDLVLAFVAGHPRGDADRLPALIRAALGGGLLIGCSAGGVIGAGSEVEACPALALTVAQLPDVDLYPFYLDADRLPTDDAPAHAWERALGVSLERCSAHFLVLPAFGAAAVDRLLEGLDRSYPAAAKIGGIAAAGAQGKGRALYLGGSTYHDGAVGVALSGNVEVDTVVSQGCRPLGEPMFVTKCRGQLLLELDGRSAGEALHRIYQRAQESDRELFRRSLCLGVIVNGDRRSSQPGEFLMRGLVGMDERSGAIAVAALLEENQVVQFHLRDARAAAEQLDRMLARYADSSATRRPEGALMFSCVGRGLALYGRPDHDSDVFRRHLGEVPLGGCFCDGEIGAVHERTFLHGFTSSFALFRGRPRG